MSSKKQETDKDWFNPIRSKLLLACVTGAITVATVLIFRKYVSNNTHKGWEKLRSFPYVRGWRDSFISILINDNKMITIHLKRSDSFNIISSEKKELIISSLDIANNEWKDIIKTCDDINYDKISCAVYDSCEQSIYFFTHKQYSVDSDYCYEIDLKTNKINLSEIAGVGDEGRRDAMIYYNNNLHSFNGMGWGTHSILKNNTNIKPVKFEEFYDLKIQEPVLGLNRRNSILLIGSPEKYMGLEHFHCVHQVNLDNNTRSKWNIQFPANFHSFGSVITSDDQYLLLFGGYIQRELDDDWDSDHDDDYKTINYNIWILRIGEQEKFIKSKVKCPETINYDCCKAFIISEDTEQVIIINDGNFWKINVDDIL